MRIFAPMTPHQDKFARWLVETGARKDQISGLIDAFCRFLNKEGFRIRRFNLVGQTLHPVFNLFRYLWFDQWCDPGHFAPTAVVSRSQFRFGDAMVDELQFVGDVKSENFLKSPFHQMDLHGELSASIAPPGDAQAFPIFDELARIGCTAYFGVRLDDFSGMSKRVAVATDLPEGFSEAQLDDLRSDLRFIGLLLRALVERDIKLNLAKVYLGKDPGERVCGGMIHPGDVISVEAAIWFSDLRGFTRMSGEMDAEGLLAELNSYFACAASAITDNGGEILKFIGDAVLAVFPVRALGGERQACLAALAALHDKAEGLEMLNDKRVADGRPPFADGVALHFGDVRYGNIGNRDRLDFTIVGHEVNVASRLEGLCAQLDEPVICSNRFSDVAEIPMRPLGEFEVKGVAYPVTACAPARR